MKKRTRLGCWLGFAALCLALLCTAAAGIAYFAVRARAFNSRPLVLIHAPVNHEQAQLGDGVFVHATARSQNGVRRIELWVDDTLVDARDAEPGTAPKTLVFSGSWIPTMADDHVLIVRATSADGTQGQASIVVKALEAAVAESAVQDVAQGEAAGGEPAAGSEAPVGGDSSAEGGSSAGGDGSSLSEPPIPEEGSEPPPVEDAPPGSITMLLRAFPFVPSLPLGQAEPFDLASEPAGLRLEFLTLSTASAFEQLHCYVGFAGSQPRSYPDQDGDQSTDESFVAAGAAALGGLNWSVGGLSGEAMPLVLWPRNQDLPISVSCVGIAGGGTQAVELGPWDGSVTPDRWTGMILTGGVPGSYEFSFRISRAEGGGRGFDVILDPKMTGPSRVWLDEGRSSLRWEFASLPGEESIDGFRFYLNGTLQWVVGSAERETTLPPEWFHPLCDTTYTFGVSAYRQGLPDGPESYPSEVALESPEQNCSREVLVRFLTLETFELGDDQEEHFEGDVGPTYGSLYANEKQVMFDGGSLGPGLGIPGGFSDNSTYDFTQLWSSGEWQFSDDPAILVALDPEGTFDFGFDIDDRDSGRCHEASDVGCDEMLCDGHFARTYHADTALMDQHNEGEILSDNGRCRVTYEWGPTAGSGVGAGGDPGGAPLPWLTLEDFEVSEGTGLVRLHVRNVGNAAWPARNLVVELQSREGASLGAYTWPNFELGAGERLVLERPEMRLEAPFDACVMIDPYDDVAERYESIGFSHQPQCQPLPDLTISRVQYLPVGEDGHVRVTVENVGEGALRSRSVSLRAAQPGSTTLASGTELFGTWPNLSLGSHESTTLDIPGVTPAARSSMREGYVVGVNPDRTILESDFTNNVYEVPAGARLRMKWISVTAPYSQRNTSAFSLKADIVSGGARRPIADWGVTDPDWSGSCIWRDNCTHNFGEYDYAVEDWFDIYGDEALEISAMATQSTIIAGTNIGDFTEAGGWGGGQLDSMRRCGTTPGPAGDPGRHAWTLAWYPGYYTWGVSYEVVFQICREGAE